MTVPLSVETILEPALLTLPTLGIWSLSWSPDAAHIAVGLNHGAVVVLHAQSALAATTGRGEITQVRRVPVCGNGRHRGRVVGIMGA